MPSVRLATRSSGAGGQHDFVHSQRAAGFSWAKPGCIAETCCVRETRGSV